MSRIQRYLILTVVGLFLPFTGCVQVEDDGTGKRLARLSDDYTYSAAHNPTPESPLTLEGAVEYALLHNLSIRAAELEFAIQTETRDSRYLRMLPSLNVRANGDSRNRYDASVSETLNTGRRGTSYSTSDDKDHASADVSLVWSLLDFGLSYVRAFQQEENLRISQEQLRRLRQQVAMEAAIAYHRAAAAAETLRVCASLADAIQIQLDSIAKEAELRNISRLDESRRSLPFLVGLRRLDDIKGEELTARVNLARAMGCPRPQDIQLPDEPSAPIEPTAPADIDSLVCFALAHRPEVFQDDSKVRLSEAEAKAALLQIAPNVTLSAGYNYDDNSFLLYDNWLSAGLSMAWNLFSLPARYKDYKVAKQRIELERQKESITAASIVMQVHLAALETGLASKRLLNAARIEATHGNILGGIEANVRDGKSHQADLLLERLRYIVELHTLSKSKADYLAAQARLFAALGVDPGTPPPFEALAVAVGEQAP